MPLTRADYQGHDFNRSVCTFTMRNGADTVQFAASWALMDAIEPDQRSNTGQRDAQFARLRDRLEGIADRKFFSMRDGERPSKIIILTAMDVGV
jgi:hypothetical protein